MKDTVATKLHNTIDARIWAQEFMAVYNSLSEQQIDEGLMITWFANAIMVGHDFAYNRKQKEVDKLLSLLLLTDKSVSNIVVDDVNIKQYAEYLHWKDEQ